MRTVLPLALTLPLALAACGPAPPSLAPAGPLFAAKDAAGAPPIKEGLWLSDGPVCKVDAEQSAYAWPACARWFVVQGGEHRVFEPSARDRTQGTWSRERWIVAAGEPRIIQSEGVTGEGKPVWGYQAMSSIAMDERGQITSLQTWTIDCSPPTKQDLRNHWLHEHPEKAGEALATKPEPEPDEPVTYPGYDPMCQPRTQAAVRGAAAGSRTLAVRTVWRWVREAP